MTCAGIKHCIFYACTTLRMADFHELLPCSQHDLTTTICNSDHFIQYNYMTSRQFKRLFLNESPLISFTAFLQPETATSRPFKPNDLNNGNIIVTNVL